MHKTISLDDGLLKSPKRWWTEKPGHPYEVGPYLEYKGNPPLEEAASKTFTV